MVVIDRVQGIFAGVDENSPRLAESQLGSWSCYNLLYDVTTRSGWRLTSYYIQIYVQMINTWLNVVEHVMIEYTGMMSWLFPALSRVEEVQHNAIWGHGSPSIAWSSSATNGVLVWLILAVCAETNFISVKMSLASAASTTLCGATWSAIALDQVQQSLPRVGSRTSHPWDFNGGTTRRIISTFRLAEPAIAMWARKRAPRVKSSAPYCSMVVGTPGRA